MSKPRILIVEDLPDQAQELARFLEKSGYEVTEKADNLKDALGYFYTQQPDLVIVDVYLHGKPDGITFAQRLNQNEQTKRPFIFLTQHTDMATFREARLTSPYSYLLKPFNALELQYAIDLAMEKFAGESGTFSIHQNRGILLEKHCFVKRGHSLIKVPFADIHLVEVEGKYSKVLTDEGTFTIQWTLKKLEEKLGTSMFARIHRNFIINLKSIKSIHLADQQVILSNEMNVPFSQNFKESLISQLDILK